MSEQELREYIHSQLNPIFEPLMVELVQQRPKDVIHFVKHWLDTKGKQIVFKNNRASPQPPPPPIDYHSDSEDGEEDEEIDDLPSPILKQKSAGRVSVSAEVYGHFNRKEDFVARVIHKSHDQKDRIRLKISQSFMFASLDHKDMNTVIDAMGIKEYEPGQWVIKQGEDGDYLYVVDSGELDCYKIFKQDQDPVHLKVYQPGESFGELSLLYNVPRAASIQAKTPSVLFALDRATFNNIVKDAAVKKREQYEHVLSKIEILQSLDKYELTQICDGIKEQRFSAGEYIIRQGDSGDRFYMIQEGKLYATKILSGSEPERVYEYNAGDYFGEISLIRNVPRQANIIAETDGVVVYLDSKTFKRLLGPIEDILKRNEDRYEKFVKVL